jgi:predicted exporter
MLKMVNFNLVKKIRFFGMYGIVIHILAGLFLLKHFASRNANHAVPSATRLARYRHFCQWLRHRSQHRTMEVR